MNMYKNNLEISLCECEKWSLGLGKGLDGSLKKLAQENSGTTEG
jgi:hypothetical protein